MLTGSGNGEPLSGDNTAPRASAAVGWILKPDMLGFVASGFAE